MARLNTFILKHLCDIQFFFCFRKWKHYIENHLIANFTRLTPLHSISPPLLSAERGVAVGGWGGQPSVPNFEKWGIRTNMSARGVLKNSHHRYGGGLLCFLSKKTLLNEIWFWGLNFQMPTLACFSQTTN